MQGNNGFGGWFVVAVATVAMVVGMILTRSVFDAGRMAASAQVQSPAALDGNLTLKSLAIVGENGRASIAMGGTESGAGLWLYRPDGAMVSITAMNDRLAVSLFSKGDVDSGGKVASLALLLDGAGRPVVQFRGSDGEPNSLPLQDLAKAAK